MNDKTIDIKKLEELAYECAIRDVDIEETIKSITSWKALHYIVKLKNKNLDYLKKVIKLKEDK